MKGSFYLNNYMLENGIKYSYGMINYNNSHAGSGKSTHIFHKEGLIFNTSKFVKDEGDGCSGNRVKLALKINKNLSYNLSKIIYVTDNTMNKDSILNNYEDITNILDKKFFKIAKEDDFTCEIEKWVKSKGKIAVLTYAQFANIMSKKYLREFIYNYINLVVMDEFHNLYDYSSKFDGEDSQYKYANIIDALYPLCKNCLLVCLSATPYYIENSISNSNEPVEIIYNKVLKNDDLKEIIHYEEKEIDATVYPINFIKKFCFNKVDCKMLIYTDRIDTATKYKELLSKNGYNAEYICTEKKMNCTQKELKQYILTNKKLPEELDVLIINKAYDTGWDCKDDNVQIVIVDSPNKTTIIQARNRVRHDLQRFIYKTKNKMKHIEVDYIVDDNGYSDTEIEVENYYENFKTWTTAEGKVLKHYWNYPPFKFEVDEKFIGNKLTKKIRESLMNEVVKKYGRNSLSETSFVEFKEDLEFNGYVVKTFKGKNNGTYIFKNGEEIRKDLSSNIKKEVKTVNNEELYKYLDSIVDNKLYKNSQEDLINLIGLKDARGRLQKSIKSINAYLEENFNMQVISKRVKVSGKLETVWEVSYK